MDFSWKCYGDDGYELLHWHRGLQWCRQYVEYISVQQPQRHPVSCGTIRQAVIHLVLGSASTQNAHNRRKRLSKQSRQVALAGDHSAECETLRRWAKLCVNAGLIPTCVEPIPTVPPQEYSVETVERETRVGVGKLET